jgi:hypothetical protein
METELLWDVDCAVRIDDVLEVRTRKTKDGFYQKDMSDFCFKFDETGVTICCGKSCKKIEAKDMPRFFVKRAYETQLNGIVLDYFLTTFEDSYVDVESEYECFRFMYCKESDKSVFQYESIKH